MITVRVLDEEVKVNVIRDDSVKINVMTEVVMIPTIPSNYGLITYNGYDITVS